MGGCKWKSTLTLQIARVTRGVARSRGDLDIRKSLYSIVVLRGIASRAQTIVNTAAAQLRGAGMDANFFH